MTCFTRQTIRPNLFTTFCLSQQSSAASAAAARAAVGVAAYVAAVAAGFVGAVVTAVAVVPRVPVLHPVPHTRGRFVPALSSRLRLRCPLGCCECHRQRCRRGPRVSCPAHRSVHLASDQARLGDMDRVEVDVGVLVVDGAGKVRQIWVDSMLQLIGWELARGGEPGNMRGLAPRD